MDMDQKQIYDYFTRFTKPHFRLVFKWITIILNEIKRMKVRCKDLLYWMGDEISEHTKYVITPKWIYSQVV